MSLKRAGLALLWLVSPPGLGLELSPALDLDGSAHLGVWSSSRNLDNAQGLVPASLWLQAKIKPSESLNFFADLRAGTSAYFGDTSGVVLRELYADLHGSALDLRLGNQILPWGRADRLNPTDSWTSRDYRWLVGEEEDQRYGNTGAKLTSYFGGYAFSLVWMPWLRTTRIPLPRALDEVSRTENPQRHDHYGVKLDHSSGGFDWSISYTHGQDTAPSLALDSTTPGSFILTHDRLQRIGADFAYPVDAYGLRGEVAYTAIDSAEGLATGAKQPYVYAVLGIDRTFGEGWYLNLQGFWQSIQDWTDPADWPRLDQQRLAATQQLVNQQTADHTYGLSLRFAKSFWNETGQIELTGLAKNDGEWTLKPRFHYKWSDNTRLDLGADLYDGDHDSILGLFRKNNLLFVEWIRHF
ncbi:conserved hypothetical protein [Gammaproteobacteria bacterium]